MNMDNKPPTPQLDKLISFTEEWNDIAMFLDWLIEESPYVIGVYELEETEGYRRLWPARKNFMDLLYEYFALDPEIIEQERVSLMDWIRQGHDEEEGLPAMKLKVTVDGKEEIL